MFKWVLSTYLNKNKEFNFSNTKKIKQTRTPNTQARKQVRYVRRVSNKDIKQASMLSTWRTR